MILSYIYVKFANSFPCHNGGGTLLLRFDSLLVVVASEIPLGKPLAYTRIETVYTAH
jgi:hypothetical protein